MRRRESKRRKRDSKKGREIVNEYCRKFNWVHIIERELGCLNSPKASAGDEEYKICVWQQRVLHRERERESVCM